MRNARHPEEMSSALRPRRHDTSDIPLVEVDHGEPWTTSLLIAQKFKKRHDNVLRAIEKLDCSEEFRRLNFEEADYLDDQRKPRPLRRISRDGFSFLAMGFTGREAATWKERFIAAFRHLEHELRRISENTSVPDWQQARQLGKADRRDLTDAVKALCERAHERGDSTTPLGLWEISATKFVIGALFENDHGERIAAIRDRLTVRQLQRLGLAESVYANAIAAHLESDIHHRAINVEAKHAVVAFAGMTGGKEVPGMDRRPLRIGGWI
jgi:Rha family phage regulatory protein